MAHLCDLSTLVVAAYEGYSIRVAHLLKFAQCQAESTMLVVPELGPSIKHWSRHICKNNRGKALTDTAARALVHEAACNLFADQMVVVAQRCDAYF